MVYYNLFVDTFTDDPTRAGWERFGSPPYLHDTDEDYIRQAGAVGDIIGNFGFANLPQTIGKIVSCWIYLKSYQEGTLEEIDVYLHDGLSWRKAGTIVPESTYTFQGLNATSILGTFSKINNALMYLDYNPVGAPDYVYVNRAYLRVRVDPKGNWIDHLPVEVTYSIAPPITYLDGLVCLRVG